MLVELKGAGREKGYGEVDLVNIVQTFNLFVVAQVENVIIILHQFKGEFHRKLRSPLRFDDVELLIGETPVEAEQPQGGEEGFGVEFSW